MFKLWLVCFFLILSGFLGAAALGAKLLKSKRTARMKRALGNMPSARSRVIATSALQPTNATPLTRLALFRRLDEQIQGAGLAWRVDRVAACACALAIVAALAGWRSGVLLNPALTAAGFAFLGAALPWVYVHRKRKSRLAAFEQQFPDALDFLSRSVRAGHALSISMEMLAAEFSDPLRTEFLKVANEQALGSALGPALAGLARRIPLIDVGFFMAGVMLQRETGGNLSEILTKLAYLIRERFRVKGKVRAATAHGQITALVLTVLPVGLAVGLSMIAPDYLQSMAKDPLGRLLIFGAISGQVLSYLLMQKIVNIKV